jgi:hypothetical protein
VRRQDQEHCASITSMIRHYVARRAQVTEGHPHNAELSASLALDSASALFANVESGRRLRGASLRVQRDAIHYL